MTKDELDQLTEKIISCAYTVSNKLGCGFLEKVYQNAVFKELNKSGFCCEKQKMIKVFYKGENVGEIMQI